MVIAGPVNTAGITVSERKQPVNIPGIMDSGRKRPVNTWNNV